MGWKKLEIARCVPWGEGSDVDGGLGDLFSDEDSISSDSDC